MSWAFGEWAGSGEITLATAEADEAAVASRAVPVASRSRRGRVRRAAKAAPFYAESSQGPEAELDLAGQPVSRGEPMDTRADSRNGAAAANATTEAALKRMAAEDPELAARLVVHTLPAAAAPLPVDLSWHLRVQGVGEWTIASAGHGGA